MGGMDGEKQKDFEDYAGAGFEELWDRIRLWSVLCASVSSKFWGDPFFLKFG